MRDKHNREQDKWIWLFFIVVIIILFISIAIYTWDDYPGSSTIGLFSKVEQLPEHPVVPDYSQFETFDAKWIYASFGVSGAVATPLVHYGLKTATKNKKDIAVIKNDIHYIRQAIADSKEDIKDIEKGVNNVN